MTSQFRKGSRLHRLLYGDGEGTFEFRKGFLSYSYSNDQFVVKDREGQVVLRTDLGEHVERWLVKNEWTPRRT